MYVLQLSQVDPDARAEVGGKAAGLARLAREGFAVPPAFVITTTATALLDGDAPWPPGLRQAVLAAYRAIAPNGEAVAVRSSATDEDSADASFAGQHLTVLDVRDEDGVLQAVRDCVASLRSESAVSYRKAAGNADGGRMAVVVQRMVRADAAGVAFTADPVTGDTDRVVVEAVAGLGEALVSGQAEAHRFMFERETLAPTGEHVPADGAVLDAERATRVAKEALRAEAAFGAPQDIEWAMEGGDLWLLQSRPISTKAAPEAGWVSEFDTPTNEDDFWTSANVQEILPGLVTPLTITTFNDAMPLAYTSDYQDLGLLDRDEWPLFTGCFYNRIFLNIAAMRLVSGRALGGSADAIEQRYLGGARAASPKPPLSERLPQWKYRLRSAPKLISMFVQLQKSAEKAERRVMALEPKVYALDPATLSDERLERLRVRLAALGVDVAKVHLRVTAAAGQGFDMVDRLVRPILGDETDGRLPVLFTGLQGVESAQISLDLWELSRVAVRQGIADRLRAEDFDPWREQDPAWRAAFRAFIDRHGHRGLNEMELAARTWRADPSPALAVVKSFLDLPEDQSPKATLERQKAERLELTRELESKMNPAKRGVFRWALKDAQRWVSLRERTKSVLVREARWFDHFTPELQRRFMERGLIDQPDDLFFLTTGEVTEILTGHAADDYRERVIRRRREFERNRHVMLPERFHGRPVPLAPEEAGHSGDVLTGTPVSAGTVTGRARVILDPRVEREFAPGEILVAPVTDAGWTPLFALASGLVVDMGSALSHGSTVAREYGLPAVVNVRHATRLIRTGDLIAVNGTKGTVTIIESAG